MSQFLGEAQGRGVGGAPFRAPVKAGAGSRLYREPAPFAPGNRAAVQPPFVWGTHHVAVIASDYELFGFPHPPPRPSDPEACGLRHLAFAFFADPDGRPLKL